MKNATKKSTKTVKSASKQDTADNKSATKAQRKANKAANRSRFAAAAVGSKLAPESVGIAASIIAPDAFPPQRYQDGYDAEPTALFEPKTITDINFSLVEGGQDSLGYPTDEQWLFAFRDPRRGLLVQNHLNSGSSVDSYYKLVHLDGTTTVTSPAGTAMTFASADVSLGLPLHGPVLMGGTPKDEGSPGAYFPISYGDQIVQTNLSGLPSLTAVALNVALCDGDDVLDPVLLTATTTAGGACTWTLNNASLNIHLDTSWTGYIRIDSVSAATSFAEFVIKYLAGNACFRHLTMGSFEEVDGIIDSFRANGLSLMFTNTAAELNLQGDVVACQIPKSVSWPSLLLGGYTSLEQRPLAVPLVANKGIQLSWKPTSPTDMQFVDVGLTQTDSNFYSISPESDYLAICIRIPKSVGRSGKAQLHCNAEGRTSSPWFGLATDRAGDRVASAAAMDFVRGYPQVHENPSHVRDAIAFLKKNRKGISAIAGALGAAIPGLAPLTSAVGAVASQL